MNMNLEFLKFLFVLIHFCFPFYIFIIFTCLTLSLTKPHLLFHVSKLHSRLFYRTFLAVQRQLVHRQCARMRHQSAPIDLYQILDIGQERLNILLAENEKANMELFKKKIYCISSFNLIISHCEGLS